MIKLIPTNVTRIFLSWSQKAIHITCKLNKYLEFCIEVNIPARMISIKNFLKSLYCYNQDKPEISVSICNTSRRINLLLVIIMTQIEICPTQIYMVSGHICINRIVFYLYFSSFSFSLGLLPGSFDDFSSSFQLFII